MLQEWHGISEVLDRVSFIWGWFGLVWVRLEKVEGILGEAVGCEASDKGKRKSQGCVSQDREDSIEGGEYACEHGKIALWS